jgi:hypothetical protein
MLVLAQLQDPTLSLQGGWADSRHTLLLSMLFLGLLGLAAFGLLYYRKRNLQTTVEDRFKAFRQHAVALMDELDALRKRHTTLPATDPDFTVPMQGATLALYSEVNRDLDGLWERWLSVMEIWDQAQRRIRTGSGLAIKPTEEARRLLEGGEIDDLVRRSTSCKERLDQLNEAHEQAREDLAAARAELAAIQSSVSKGTGVLLPSDPHHREVAAAETAMREADFIMAADPIGAGALILRAHRSLSSLSDRPDPGPARRRFSPTPHPMIDDLAAAAERLRASAVRLGIAGILGLFVKAWIAVWLIGLVFGMILPFLTPILFLAGFVIILAGGLAVLLAGFFLMMAGGLAVVRALTSWLWFGLGGPRR